MNRILKKTAILLVIGIISGIVLALFLKLIQILTNSTAFVLLFEVGYIPFLNELKPIWLAETIFHFSTSSLSIIVLYWLLSLKQMERNIWAYIALICAGSTALFLLTIFSDKTPAVTDYPALVYWVGAHFLFAGTAGLLIRKWV